MPWQTLDGRSLRRAEFDRRRPDLPHCGWCNDGQLCNCAVYSYLWEENGRGACACVGFISCPVCPRAGSGGMMISNG